MTDHYEDTEDQKERVLKNSQVLGFIARFWLRRPWLLTGTVTFVVAAIAFDLATPWASGRLVDAVTHGPGNSGGAWRAWAVFVGVYFAFSMIRNLSMRFWIPLASANMKEMTDEGFKKVQSFSGASAARCGAMTRSPTRPWSSWARRSSCSSACAG
jgi:ATP-binding cassette subfamily B protein